MPYKEAATQIREITGVFDSIIGILQPKRLGNFIKDKDEAQVLPPDDDFVHVLANEKNVYALQKNIKEYATIKHILEKNSDFIRPTNDSQRVKVVDCMVMNAML